MNQLRCSQQLEIVGITQVIYCTLFNNSHDIGSVNVCQQNLFKYQAGLGTYFIRF